MTQPLFAGGPSDFAPRTASEGQFAYEKRVVSPKEHSQLQVAFMEIPPGKSAFPYHWHETITEAYVILSGTALIRTAEGERRLEAGEVIVFPPGPAGAHRITNPSADEPLRYVDLDTTSNPDVIRYPDSDKTAVVAWGSTLGMWRDADQVDYYDGEPDAQ